MSCSSDVYNDIHRSIMTFCNEFIIRNSISDLKVFDFDSHATVQELPNSNLIGPAEYSIENQTDKYMVTCMIMVCTKSDDAYLKTLREIVGMLFKELKPGSTGQNFSIVDDKAIRRGYLTVAGDVLVTPVGATKTRPIQAFAVQFAAGYSSLPTD